MNTGHLVDLIASTTSSNSYTPTFPGGIIAWIICSSRKRQQFGGWLLFYYWQLYSGVLMTALFFGMAFQSYVPESYDNPKTYHLFLTSVVPTIVFFAIQVVVATMLVSVKEWSLLKLLRWTILAEVVAACVGLVIDAFHFPESAPLDFITLIPAMLWLGYFMRSVRVKHVFLTHDWDVAVNAMHPA